MVNDINNLEIFKICINSGDTIACHYYKRNYNQVMQEIMRLADIVNQYIALEAPWKLAKNNPQDKKIQQICSQGLQCFICLIVYLKPATPDLAAKAEKFFNFKINTWQDSQHIFNNHKLNKFTHLMARVPDSAITKFNNMIAEND